MGQFHLTHSRLRRPATANGPPSLALALAGLRPPTAAPPGSARASRERTARTGGLADDG